MTTLANHHTLITGGASGIGRLMAHRLAGAGARLTIWDINRANLDRTVDELNRIRPESARGFLCDISNREQVYDVAAESIMAGGPVDILINNAGIVSGARLIDLPDEKIEATFAINTLGLFWVTKSVLPEMIRRNYGHIVTLASASAMIGVAKLSDYAASKWAAMGFDESLRAELREMAPGVVTTVVCPFYIDTGMFRGVKTRFPWLLPILKEEYVADQIISAIQSNRRRLVLPRIVGIVPLLRALPVPAFDWIATFLGINSSMDQFKGR